MNCQDPKCNHPKIEHKFRGCYHIVEGTRSFCDCVRSDKDIEISALQSENARLRAALEWQSMDSFPENESVLVLSEYGNIWMAKYKYIGPRAGKRWQTYGLGALPFQPVAWMKMPNPPSLKDQAE